MPLTCQVATAGGGGRHVRHPIGHGVPLPGFSIKKPCGESTTPPSRWVAPISGPKSSFKTWIFCMTQELIFFSICLIMKKIHFFWWMWTNMDMMGSSLWRGEFWPTVLCYPPSYCKPTKLSHWPVSALWGLPRLLLEGLQFSLPFLDCR